jgi:Zn-dependent M28 family amino/carboxypeptidase
VVGIIPGATRPGEVFIYSAHWDHFGRNDASPGSDKIFNGAVDNGMGTAMVLELAEKFAAQKRPQRSIAFAFWTLEEQGLLGSQYFGEHPLWPRDHIVAVLNTDADRPKGLARDMTLPGSGQSELEEMLVDALATQHRTLAPDPNPELGHFYRSDHFSLAKQGIPAFSPGGGMDMIEGGTAAGQALADKYVAENYHQPNDEWFAGMDFSGPAQDTRAFYIVGDTLANGTAWPNFYPDSEFRPLRDKVRPK